MPRGKQDLIPYRELLMSMLPIKLTLLALLCTCKLLTCLLNHSVHNNSHIPCRIIAGLNSNN